MDTRRICLVVVLSVLASLTAILLCKHLWSSAESLYSRAASETQGEQGVIRAEAKLIAEAKGKQGVIRVEERNGMRLLTIDEVVQGGMPIGLEAAQRFIDPMVELIRTVRPKAKSVLVIGLGTGKSAVDLASVGFSVETVELEPVVIDFAYRYFGYNGQVVEADGLEYLKQTRKKYDVILMDAFFGEEAPAHLVSKEAFGVMRGCLSCKDALIAVRLLSFPDDPEVSNILRNMGWFTYVFGSGIGPEKQNLYILHSKKSMSITRASVNLPLPVTSHESSTLLPGRRRSIFEDEIEKNLGGEWSPLTKRERRVIVLGYLIRDRETKNIFIDLPHYGMGAVRYLIVGDLLPKLDELLGKKGFFLHHGEITSRNDRRLRQTLSGLLGVSGARGNETMHSPVVVAVEGIACVRSINPEYRSDPLFTNNLGILYELDVSKVLMSLDHKSWKEFKRKKLEPIIGLVERAFAAGDIEQATAAITDYLEAVDCRLNGFGSKCAAYNGIAKFKWVLDIEKAELGKQASAFEIAAACDWASGFLSQFWYNEHAKIIRDAIRECAERNYKTVTENPKDPNAQAAAARLLYLSMQHMPDLDELLDELAEEDAVQLQKRLEDAIKLEKRVNELRRVYEVIEPARQPPHREAKLDRLRRKMRPSS